MINCCCAVAERVRGVRFFLLLRIAPGGAKCPRSFSSKCPGHVLNAPGCFFKLAQSEAPRGTSTTVALLRYVYMQKCTFGGMLSGGRVSFSHFRLRGKQGGHRYITTHVWILAELRGGAPSIQHRRAGSFFQGVAFRLAEAIRGMEKPTFKYILH